MKIILYQPQIPQNTGNIVRTCSTTNCGLILVRPLGFSTQSRRLKRAGLDYWEGVEVEEIDDLIDYLENTTHSFFFFSSKGKKRYTEAPYDTDSFLIFGSETEGLPEVFWNRWPDRFYTIPMAAGRRCLNLASSAAIALFEAQRQLQFPFLNNNERAPLSSAEVVKGT